MDIRGHRTKVGRNEPCPCGSGKKYKKCCWDKNFTWVTDEQGNLSREFPIDNPELVSLLDQARAKFRNQHGRDPKDSDLLFDAMDEDDIERTMVDIMERAGSDPAFVYAFRKTGRIVTTWNKDKLTDTELREWQAAIEEYRASTEQSNQPQKDDLPARHDVNEGIYQLKVTLKESKPPIWRRFQVPGNVTLHRLHLILQSVMGWTNSHLYRFEIEGTEYGEPDPEYTDNGIDMTGAKRAKLNRVAPSEKMRFGYEYDFGDSWEHKIQVEKILPPEPGAQYPICLAGKRACPPEDCGGIWGYDELLEIIRDSTHEEYERMTEWLGGSFDPEEFDIAEVNRSLKRFRQSNKSKRPDVPEAFQRAFESEDDRR